MEDKIELVQIGEDERSRILRYNFVIATSGKKWKIRYKQECTLYEIEPIEQGELSDYEYFIKTHPDCNNTENNTQYFLVVNGKPVTKVILEKDLLDLVNITLSTPTIYSKNGYATTSVELIEELLFSKENVRGLKIIDLHITGDATSRIAKKLKFVQVGDNTFVKYNERYKPKTNGNIEHEGETK